jgi:hypothetical protein
MASRNAVKISGSIAPGSVLGAGPAPASIVSSILSSVWGGANENPLEFDYMANWHDIHGRHNGRTLVAESRRLTEEAINARGHFFLAATAPVLLTDEMYLTVSTSEPYIMPLDAMAMQATPYESNRVTSQRTYGLESYKGIETITSEFLRDVYYGKESLSEMSYVLSRRMLVTLVDNAAMAVVDVPWRASVDYFKLQQNGKVIGHFVAMEGLMFAGVNKNPLGAITKILNKRTMRRPIDRIVVAEAKSHVFSDALKQPKNTAYYTLTYDDATGKVISMMFDNGEPSLGSIAVGHGGEMQVIEAPTQVSSSLDNEEDGVQRLRTWPVIGELITERAPLPLQQATCSPEDVDVQCWSESMTEITHPILRHNHGLMYCGVFNTFNVPDSEKDPMGPFNKLNKNALADENDFGEEYKELVREYNANASANSYLAADNPSDNNTVPHGTTNKKTLDDMKNWRHYYPIMGVYTDLRGNTVINIPKSCGNVSLRGIHPSTFRDAALKIAKKYAPLIGTGKDEELLRSVWDSNVAGIPGLNERVENNFGQSADHDAMDIDAPVTASVFEQDRSALARVASQRDFSSAVLGHFARGPGSFLEHARHIPDSHIDSFITFYKAALDQLHGLAGNDQLPAATENFNKRLNDLQTLRGQPMLLQAVNRASDKIGDPNTASLATWKERLYKNAELSKASLQNASFTLDGLLKRQTSSSSSSSTGGLGVKSTPLGQFGLFTRLDPAIIRGAFEKHVYHMRNYKLGDTVESIYEWLLMMPFTYWTLNNLYQVFGVTLVNINRYRNRQYYQMSALCGFVSDRSYITMFTHPQARSGVNHIHGMVSETIEFRSAVIPLEPDTTFIFPYAFCDRLMNEINCRPARNLEEATSSESDAPSCIQTMVPRCEYQYDHPFSFTGRDIHENKPYSKHSDTAMILKLFDQQWLSLNGASDANPVIYEKSGVFSDIIHRSWKRVYDDRIKAYVPINGSGPREESYVNCREAHDIWVGVEPRFPNLIENCTYVPIEINVV